MIESVSPMLYLSVFCFFLFCSFSSFRAQFIISSGDDSSSVRRAGVARFPILRHCKARTDGEILVPIFNLYSTEQGKRPPSISTRAREAAIRRPWAGRDGQVVAGYTLYPRSPGRNARQCSEQTRLGADGAETPNVRAHKNFRRNPGNPGGNRCPCSALFTEHSEHVRLVPPSCSVRLAQPAQPISPSLPYFLSLCFFSLSLSSPLAPQGARRVGFEPV